MVEHDQHVPDRRGADLWTRSIAITMAVNTVMVAALTWATVYRASEAREKDRSAVLQTVQSELVRVGAQVQVYSEQSNAAGYLATKAEVRAITSLGQAFARSGDLAAANAYAEEADTRLAAAEASARLGFDPSYVTKDSTYDVQGKQEALISEKDQSARSTEAPDDAAAKADQLHGRADKLAWLVVVLVGGILLLTVARIRPGNERLRLLAAAWSLLVVVGAISTAIFFMG
jgi:hypothetical protein